MANKQAILIFTGGHHTSALAVAKNFTIPIVWFGHRHSAWGDLSDSAEYTEVTSSGIKFINLQAGKFHRTFNLLKLLRLPWGFIQSFYYLVLLKKDYNVKGIVSFGGYLAVPVVICGRLLGISAITHEQTLVAGKANRLIAVFCKKIALSWPQSQKYFPAQKSVLVGLPLREEILTIPKTKPSNIIYITGGKQGSHILNSVTFKSLPNLLKKYQIIHQTGSNSRFRDYEKSQSLKFPGYESFTYADGSTTARNLQKAHIVISRSGAHTIAELLYLRKKAVLIPIPWVSHNEQSENAKLLASLNLAVILPQAQLSPDTLHQAIKTAENLHPKNYSFDYHGLKNFTRLIKQEFHV